MSVMCQDVPGSPPAFRLVLEVEPGKEARLAFMHIKKMIFCNRYVNYIRELFGRYLQYKLSSQISMNALLVIIHVM